MNAQTIIDTMLERMNQRGLYGLDGYIRQISPALFFVRVMYNNPSFESEGDKVLFTSGTYRIENKTQLDRCADLAASMLKCALPTYH